MSMMTALGRRANRALGRVNLKLLRRTDWELLHRSQIRYEQLLHRLHIDETSLFAPTLNTSSVPADARDYLCPENPRLQDLIRRYRDLDHPVLRHSVWTDDYVGRQVDLQLFRGDLAYVYQFLDLNIEVNYFVTFQYLNALDELRIFDRIAEDSLFGANTLSIGGTIVSRDLLDSINEIYFLERALGLSSRTNFNVLDIGAGYGRFAHRLTKGLPDFGHVFCVDAVAISTFICEYYLGFRGADDRASVVPLDELDALLALQPIDLAVNIHSFSECQIASIAAWLDIVTAHDVRYLFIVPNGPGTKGSRLLSTEGRAADGSESEPRDFFPLIADRGYELLIEEPKYREELVQQYGVSPTRYYLFERPPH